MAFPTTGVLDNFNRANEDPATGWAAFAGDSDRLEIISNQAADNFAGLNRSRDYYTAATYGPDMEAYVTIATKPGTGHDTMLIVRGQNPGSGTADGYMLRVVPQAGDDLWTISRLDNASTGNGTTLGVSVAQEFAVNDKIGLEIVGTTINAYLYTAGAWSLVMSRTDSTYSGAGYIGLGLEATTGRFDDFGGGTISVKSLPPRRPPAHLLAR